MSGVCPCCGGDVSAMEVVVDEARGLVARNGTEVHLTRAELRIVAKLRDERPGAVDRTVLREAYAPNTTVANAENSTSVIICRLRPKLEVVGLTIEGTIEGYRIHEVEPKLGGERDGVATLPEHVAAEARDLCKRGFPRQMIATKLRVPFRLVDRALQDARP